MPHKVGDTRDSLVKLPTYRFGFKEGGNSKTWLVTHPRSHASKEKEAHRKIILIENKAFSQKVASFKQTFFKYSPTTLF